MDLAKQHIDIGLYTNQREEQLAFWQVEIGLEFDHVGKLGGGVHQLRHHMNGSILKINHARDPLPDMAPSGYRRLLIAKPDLTEVQSLSDPDGNAVDLGPMGHKGVLGIGIEIAVSDLAAAKAAARSSAFTTAKALLASAKWAISGLKLGRPLAL